MSTYLTIADVTSRLTGSSYQTGWEALTVDQQNYGINKAQRLFESLNHQGSKYDCNQELMYPRYFEGYSIPINDDMLQGLAIESYYQGANLNQDSKLLIAAQNILEEWQGDTKAVYGSSAKEESKYLSMKFKSLEACELIYPWLAKTMRY